MQGHENAVAPARSGAAALAGQVMQEEQSRREANAAQPVGSLTAPTARGLGARVGAAPPSFSASAAGSTF